MVHLRTAIAGLLATAALEVSAHPGHDTAAELAERAAYFNQKYAKRDLAHCAEKLEKRGINERALRRRADVVDNLRRDVAMKSKTDDTTMSRALLT